MEKYKVDIYLFDIDDADYDQLMSDISDFLDERSVDYNIGVGEEM